MGMMGDDGRGFELARKLESHGVWRSWLGDPLYSSFVHVLSSAAAWEAFMRADDSKTKSQIQLQLRARALLFDKDSSTNAHQAQQHIMGIQAQLPSHQQLQFQQSQQVLRQMNPQVQHMNNPQYQALQQQQWERMRRRQQAAPPASMNMNMDNERPMVQVKMETPSEFRLDANTLAAMNSRHPQFQQLRQQQLSAISSLHVQQANQPFRPMHSLQIPQIHSPNMGIAKAPPVKVEGFQELMGGDSSMKHDSEENKLLSPPK